MKATMILGAVIGFALGAGSSLLGECAWDTLFWHAAVAALGGGLLARWWGHIWISGLTDALEQQRRARAQQAAEAKTPAKV